MSSNKQLNAQFLCAVTLVLNMVMDTDQMDICILDLKLDLYKNMSCSIFYVSGYNACQSCSIVEAGVTELFLCLRVTGQIALSSF